VVEVILLGCAGYFSHPSSFFRERSTVYQN